MTQEIPHDLTLSSLKIKNDNKIDALPILEVEGEAIFNETIIQRNVKSFNMRQASIISITKNDNTTGSNADNDINQIIFSNGCRLFSNNINEQDKYYPQLVNNGIDISGDQTNNDGLQYVIKLNEQNIASLPTGYKEGNFTKYQSFIVGTSPAFFLRATVEITDVSGTDDCLFGFRKVENFQANVDDYGEMATFNVISGGIKTETIKNSANTTTTSLTSPSNGNFADGEIWTFEILVSSNGDVTYKMGKNFGSLVEPNGAVSFQFNNGEEITPFFYILQTVDLTPVILHSFEYGLQ